MIYMPVCGADGKIYSNACEANCAGTTVVKDLPESGTEADCATGAAVNSWTSMNHGCICPMNYMPVCGADGKIYNNACNAKCAGTTVVKDLPETGTEADCATGAAVNSWTSMNHGCICPMNYMPVCGADGKIYNNACNAKCAGTTVVKDLPETGTEADCATGAAVNFLTSMNHGCICPMNYMPVCGADGKIYNNACEAKCAGTTVVKDLPETATDADC